MESAGKRRTISSDFPKLAESSQKICRRRVQISWRQATNSRRLHALSGGLLLYRHSERICGDRSIAPLFGKSFEGKQIITGLEKPGLEPDLNCFFGVQLQFIPPPDRPIVAICDGPTVGLDIRLRVKFRRKDDQLSRA